ncbi:MULTISPECIES: DUF397 domain-containing protein [Actinoalloteichus]|uniref:DUF397 domain-containing protein n=1 Tax=Actinoalloteichus TaxID=65496 RepID=UPI0009FEEACB|nr:DUF397 domain-containing protein [Actinoalloteichus spitiensis]
MITGWYKSSHSGGGSANCVEVGTGSNVVAIRDTKNREAGMLILNTRTFANFVATVKQGSLDLKL